MKMAQSSQKPVENTVGIGEIARYKQFLLFPQCFQKPCTADLKNQGLFGKGLKHLSYTYINLCETTKPYTGPNAEVCR